MENRIFCAFNSNHANNALLKQAQQQQQGQQCGRSGVDRMDVDERDGTFSKIARTGDSSTLFMSSSSGSHHQQQAAVESELRMLHMATGSGAAAALGSLVRSNSMLSDGRLGCSPTSSTASDGGALLLPASHAAEASGTTTLSADHLQRGRSDTVASVYDSLSARSLYHHSHQLTASAYTTLQAHHPSGDKVAKECHECPTYFVSVTSKLQSSTITVASVLFDQETVLASYHPAAASKRSFGQAGELAPCGTSFRGLHALLNHMLLHAALSSVDLFPSNLAKAFFSPQPEIHDLGLPLAVSGNMQDTPHGEQESMMRMGGRMQQVLFTAAQLRELQHQALVLKYIMNGVNVPADLVNPIRASLAGLSSIGASQLHLANLPWGGYRLGFGANADPEPGRCRRTDGKKWRCSKDVVPDQKYCERHIHRGRHRARKPTDTQQTGTSPGISASSGGGPSASVASSVTLAATRAPPGILSAVSAVGQQQQQLSSSLGIRLYSGTNSPSASGLSVGSSLTASQYSQLSSLHSSAHANPLTSKDYRYMSGVARSDLDLGAEQMLFAEATGSSRGMGQEYQGLNQHGLTMLSSINNSWRTASMQQSRAPSPQQPLRSSSPSLMQYNSPQVRTLLGQEFNPLSVEASAGSLQSLGQQNQHHQHSFLGGAFGSVEAVNHVGREQESQPLRHFFDDWPRSKDASTLSWSDVEDEKPNRTSSTTQLSISMPIGSSEFNAPGSPPGKLKLSPLKLSMSREGEDDIPLGVELGVGMGLGLNEDRQRHHQANWIPIAWETPVGGPLAEVLQSSTPRASKNSGLNLMTEGWEESPRHSHIASSPRDKDGTGRGMLEGTKGAE